MVDDYVAAWHGVDGESPDHDFDLDGEVAEAGVGS